ncbi:hypothetical protein DFH11DRAFT_1547987 [Phellopilus nigrolimitatus]|nr:hypothetical protein DFH11DRAFT_1547987 [Phellopilus nigrolimitatus]
MTYIRHRPARRRAARFHRPALSNSERTVPTASGCSDTDDASALATATATVTAAAATSPLPGTERAIPPATSIDPATASDEREKRDVPAAVGGPGSATPSPTTAVQRAARMSGRRRVVPADLFIPSEPKQTHIGTGGGKSHSLAGVLTALVLESKGRTALTGPSLKLLHTAFQTASSSRLSPKKTREEKETDELNSELDQLSCFSRKRENKFASCPVNTLPSKKAVRPRPPGRMSPTINKHSLFLQVQKYGLHQQRHLRLEEKGRTLAHRGEGFGGDTERSVPPGDEDERQGPIFALSALSCADEPQLAASDTRTSVDDASTILQNLQDFSSTADSATGATRRPPPNSPSQEHSTRLSPLRCAPRSLARRASSPPPSTASASPRVPLHCTERPIPAALGYTDTHDASAPAAATAAPLPGAICAVPAPAPAPPRSQGVRRSHAPQLRDAVCAGMGGKRAGQDIENGREGNEQAALPRKLTGRPLPCTERAKRDADVCATRAGIARAVWTRVRNIPSSGRECRAWKCT